MSVHMVAPEVQSLQRELRNHAELWLRIRNDAKTFEDIIAMLAAEFDIAMHGEYAEPEVNKLCQILVQKLQDRRKVIITDVAKLVELLPDHPLKHF